MRHNRKAVMAERYKLYLRKNIFNGKYFVRNVQIFVCMILAAGIMTCVFAANGVKEDEVVSVDADVSVKEALFGTEQEEKSTVKTEENQVILADTEAEPEQQTEQVTAEMLVAQNVTEATTEEKTEEPKSEFDEKCIANVEETLNVRASASTDSDFVGSMNPGAIAIVEGKEGEWIKIKSGDVEGYVLSDYVLTGKMAEQFAADFVTLRGTVLEDGVNIRAEQSTDADILTVLEKDATVRVIESAEDEQTEQVQETSEKAVAEDEVTTVGAVKAVDEEIVWLTVELEDGKTGYVSADLVEVEELYEIAVSAEELERRAAEAARIAAEEEAARQAAAANAAAQSKASKSDSDEYKGATTTPVTATESGDCLGTFTITAYCGCKKCCGGSKKTATGTTPTEGRTIAADTSILPYGTQVVIDGIVYTVEDCGSGVSGNHIDIFFATHKKAMAFGKKSMKVYKY